MIKYGKVQFLGTATMSVMYLFILDRRFVTIIFMLFVQ